MSKKIGIVIVGKGRDSIVDLLIKENSAPSIELCNDFDNNDMNILDYDHLKYYDDPIEKWHHKRKKRPWE